MPSKMILNLIFTFAALSISLVSYADTTTVAAMPTGTAEGVSADSAPAPTPTTITTTATIITPANAASTATPGVLLSSVESGTGACYASENCSGAPIASGVRQPWCDQANATHSWLSQGGLCFK